MTGKTMPQRDPRTIIAALHELVDELEVRLTELPGDSSAADSANPDPEERYIAERVERQLVRIRGQAAARKRATCDLSGRHRAS